MHKQRISGQQAYKNFGESFRKAYVGGKQITTDAAFGDKLLARESGQIRHLAAISIANLGHPEYIGLEPGEVRLANAVVGFVDIRGFTKLSFALEPEELRRVIQALTEASIRAIQEGGGYIGEFTGDGVMAYFGESSMTDEDATLAALETISLLFKSVDEIVNPELKHDGLDPIRIAAGFEFGEVLWSRIGVADISQIKPIGTATFLAGKLASGKYSNAWECKVGSELARWIPEEHKKKARQYGPFSVNKEEFSRELYLFDWKQFATDTLLNQSQLEERVRERFSAASPLGKVSEAHLKTKESRYLSALKALTEVGYNVFFDESTDCPHLVVEFGNNRNLAIIITFESASMRSEPRLFVRNSEHLEEITVSPIQWMQSGADITALVAAITRRLIVS